MLEEKVLSLVDASQSDDAARFEAYDSGEYIYGIRIDNCLNGTIKAAIHVQWPRLHCWIADAQREGKELVWSHSAIGPESVHVHVGVAGSIINYTAILERSVLLNMLKERGDVNPEMAAEDMWNLVLKYECL